MYQYVWLLHTDPPDRPAFFTVLHLFYVCLSNMQIGPIRLRTGYTNATADKAHKWMREFRLTSSSS